MQIGTSIGLALTSSIASSVSSHALANSTQPDAQATDPAVLMPGFRAAAWLCLGASALSFVIALVRLRGMGVVGALKDEQDDGQGQGRPELSLGAVEEVKAHAPVPVSVPVTMPGDVDAGVGRKSREDVDVEAQQMQNRRSRLIDTATNSTPSAQA